MNFSRESSEYGHLFGVAYRILGSAHDAEDAIGEGLVRWQSMSDTERALVREPIAWLTRVVSRICLDQLASARVRREAYSGIWLPEPVSDPVGPGPTGRPVDPADAVTLDESVSVAMLRAMESLTPGERVALILHDVFEMPFADIGEIVGRSAQACRQLASTARKHLRDGPRFQPENAERLDAVTAFVNACTTGDLDALVRVLDPAAVVHSDGGGAVSAAKVPVRGRDRVAKFLLGIVALRRRHGEELTTALTQVNNRTGLAVSVNGDLLAVMDLGVTDGLIAEVAIMLNPEKLTSFRHRSGE